MADPTSLVNTFTGTKPGDPALDAKMGAGWSNGNTYPGASVPFGMTQWSPDTPSAPPGGYAYDDERITGFGLTHLSGAGCPTYGDGPIMPVNGAPTVSPATDPERYHAGFRHADERAVPGSYEVRLDNGATVRLAASPRGGAGRIGFRGGNDATLLINSSGSTKGVTDARLRIVDEHTVVGQATSGTFCDTDTHYTVYFAYRFDHPFTGYGTWSGDTVTPGARESAGPRSGGYVSFGVRDIGVSMGLSFTDEDGALANLRAETAGRTYESVARGARDCWHAELSRIEVHGGREADLRTFYTSLYHVLLGPTLFSDVDGRYRGFDDRIHHVPPGHAQYANFSNWDTYRTHAQLVALLDPVRASDIAQSLVRQAEHSGQLPRISYANRHTSVMVGDPSDPILAGVYAFGARDFDVHGALRAMVDGASTPRDPATGYVQREGLSDYLRLGYVPHGAIDISGSAGITLEYTTSDFSIAQLADALGERDIATEFTRRAQNWQHLVDPATGSLAPRMMDGSLLPEHHPSRMTGWVEGSRAQHAWMVPYNLDDVITAAGGREAAVSQLDDHFAKLNEGARSKHAFMGNEPNLVVPWAYLAAGAPWRTQEVVRHVQDELFAATPDGLHGNDDLGAMGAWYVWTALGVFPPIPGRAELALNTPLFPSATIHRAGGRSLTVRAEGAPDARYLRGVSVNGTPVPRAYLDPSIVEHGGVIDFRLGERPGHGWASASGEGLPSFGEHRRTVLGAVDTAAVAPGETVRTCLRLRGFAGSGTVRWWLGEAPGLRVAPSHGEVHVPPGEEVTVPVEVHAEPGTSTGFARLGLTLSTVDEPVPTARIAVAPRGSILRIADSAGTSDDANPRAADFNDYGASYSAQQLAKFGLTPGAEQTAGGIRFRWPESGPGELNNVVAHGQHLDLPSTTDGASRLGFLGAALGGNGSGTGTVHYTDGTTSPFTLRLSDWTLKGGGLKPWLGNEIVARMPYRNQPGGPDGCTTYVFLASAPVDPGKTVAGVTLPSDSEDQDLHVFAIGLGG